MRTFTTTALAATALLLAGCSGDGDATPTTTPTTSSSTTSTTSTTTTPTSEPVVTETATATATAQPPVTETATATATATATQSPTSSSSSTTTSAAPAAGTITSRGYGSYSFGESQKSVATKATADGYERDQLGRCTLYRSGGTTLVVAQGALQMVAVSGPAPRTDKGVGVGSTYAQVKKAYPAGSYRDVAQWVAPGGSGATAFTFTEEEGGQVVSYVAGTKAYAGEAGACGD